MPCGDTQTGRRSRKPTLGIYDHHYCVAPEDHQKWSKLVAVFNKYSYHIMCQNKFHLLSFSPHIILLDNGMQKIKDHYSVITLQKFAITNILPTFICHFLKEATETECLKIFF